MFQLPILLANETTNLYAALFRAMWPETKNAALYSFFLMDAEKDVFVWVQHESLLSLFTQSNVFVDEQALLYYNFSLWMLAPGGEEGPAPVTAQVVPASLVMDPPANLEDNLVDLVVPGPNFLQIFLFFGGLPNVLPIQIFTPVLFGGLIGGGILTPVAVQLAHHVNPPAAIGAGPVVPPVPVPNFWPFANPPVPNPIPDPAITAGAAGSLPANPSYVLLGSAIAILLAVGAWKYYQKKDISLEFPEIPPHVAAIKQYLAEKNRDTFSNPNIANVFPRLRENKIPFLSASVEDGIKLVGIRVFDLVPFILLNGRWNEFLVALTYGLVRRYIIRCIFKKSLTCYQAFVSGWVKNVRSLIFFFRAKKIVLIFPKSRKIFPLQTNYKVVCFLKSAFKKYRLVIFERQKVRFPSLPSYKRK